MIVARLKRMQTTQRCRDYIHAVNEDVHLIIRLQGCSRCRWFRCLFQGQGAVMFRPWPNITALNHFTVPLHQWTTVIRTMYNVLHDRIVIIKIINTVFLIMRSTLPDLLSSKGIQITTIRLTAYNAPTRVILILCEFKIKSSRQ